MAVAHAIFWKVEFMVMNKVNNSSLLRLCLLGLVALLTMPSLTAAQANTLDRIAVVVNDDVVLMSEVQQRMQVLRSGEKTTASNQQALMKAAVDELVLERLQTQYAEERGIRVDDASLNQALEKIAANNNMNLQTFQAALQRQGVDFIALRERTRQRLLVNALRRQQIARKVNVTEREIEDLVATQSAKLTAGQRYRLQHILIAAPNGTPIEQIKAARAKAEELRQRVVSGQDFAAVAQQFSDNRAANQGGDLGWQNADNLPVSFLRVLALMQPGDISEVVRDANGFHVLKLVERQGEAGGGQVTEYSVRHILASTEKHSPEIAQQRIMTAYQQLQAGADFAQLAQQYSDDPGSLNQGGNLGWVKEGQMVPPFDQTMQQQAPNTLSQPFQTRFGWHILQVMDKRQVDGTKDELRKKAANFLGKRKEEEQYRAWLQSLRNDAYIDYRIPMGKAELQLN